MNLFDIIEICTKPLDARRYHECTEVSYVGDHAFEHHAYLQVLQLLHAFLEFGVLNSGRGSGPGFQVRPEYRALLARRIFIHVFSGIEFA